MRDGLQLLYEICALFLVRLNISSPENNSKKKYMPLKHFEFQKLIMTDTFLIKLTQFEKTGSKGKFSIPLGILKTKIHFWN